MKTKTKTTVVCESICNVDEKKGKKEGEKVDSMIVWIEAALWAEAAKKDAGGRRRRRLTLIMASGRWSQKENKEGE